MQLDNARVAIVGLGLMGGSLALALRGKRRSIIGFDRSPEIVEQALQRQVVDVATPDLAGVANADIVVLATPVRTIIELIPRVAALMRPGALLLDLGSTKGQIVEVMNRLPEGCVAVGGHPMCGKETSGLDNADAGLFQGARFALVPTERSTGEALSLATELAYAVGACPLVLDAYEHDQAVAVVSHLPYLLAASLALTEQEESAGNPAAGLLAASGFRDTTRLAGSGTEMMLDILLTNREAVEQALDIFEGKLAQVRGLLADKTGLQGWLQAAQVRRMEIFS